MVGPIQAAGPGRISGQTETRRAQNQQAGGFGAVLQQEMERAQTRQVAFSKHALSRAEERGIEVTPTLLEKLGDSARRKKTAFSPSGTGTGQRRDQHPRAGSEPGVHRERAERPGHHRFVRSGNEGQHFYKH